MDEQAVVGRLTSPADPGPTERMRRIGISSEAALGVKIPHLRAPAKEIGRDHEPALRLWDRELRETMILASMIAIPAATTEDLMERWAADALGELTGGAVRARLKSIPHSGESS